MWRWFNGGDEEQSTASGVFGLALKSCLNEWRRFGDAEPVMCVGEGDGLSAGLDLPSPFRLLLEFFLFGDDSDIGFLRDRLFAIPRINV